jgi:phenylacetate-CoA ligase
LGQTDEFYDALETRSADEREADLMARLAGQIANAKQNAPYFTERLANIDAKAVTTREALARVPVTRKSDLIELQKKNPPLGGLTTQPTGKLKRLFQSPGPIYEPEGYGQDWWGTARALYAAGFRAGDLVHNTFSYHFTPAGFMLETGAAEIGCAVFPAGVGNTELQVRAMADMCPTGYTGTPSFLKILLERAEEMKLDVSSLKKALVGGEALPASLRGEIEGRGFSCQQVYATADLGAIAYESRARQGLIVDEALLVEIVRPGTDDPVPEGEVGEVVATRFAPEYPLIRFGTGDLSAVMPGASPCGRTNMRLKGWMGRADQTTKVKGMFVHPSQVAEVARRHPEILKARLVVDQRDGADVMTLSCEVADLAHVAGGADGLAGDIVNTIHAVCKLKGEVGFAEPGSLPNDGKVIDDIRKFD